MPGPTPTFNPNALENLFKPVPEIYKPSITAGTVNFQAPVSGHGDINFPYSYSKNKAPSDPMADGLRNLFNSGPTEKFMTSTIKYNADEVNAARYVTSPDYLKLGISLTGDNEENYGQNQSWSEVLSNGLAGAGKLAANGFVDGWKQWGRTFDALTHWDWDKLHGDAQSMLDLDNKLKDIMNSNPIYATKEGSETFWNRQSFGNFLQQSGFAIGAGVQMLSEQIITKAIEAGLTATGVGVGAAAELELVTDVKTAATAGRIANFFNKSKEFFNASKAMKNLKKLHDVWTDEDVVRKFAANIGQKIPGVDIAMDINKVYKTGREAGLTGTQLAGDIAKVGLGGLKRTMSEANFAFTEARMEAAGTFSDLYNQMQEDHFKRTGTFAQNDDLQTMQNTAMKAADKNFNFNSAILAVSNRIMFDNVFKNSKLTSKILSQFGEDVGEKGFKVLGKINGKTTTQYYTGGVLKNYKTIAADFGTRKARTVLAKSIMKPALKFEVSEGIQELLQEGSAEYYKDYYLNSYKATYNPDIEVSSQKSLDKAISSQMTMQGLKTFASGALTGMLLHGPTVLASKAGKKLSETVKDTYKTSGLSKEDKEKYFEEKKASKDELQNYYNEFNAIAKDPSKFFSESIKNFNVQKEGASALDEAAKLGDKFAYENIRTDMLHSMVSQAVRNDTHEALADTLREYGKHMSKEEFEQAFVGLDYSSENKKSAVDYTEKVARSVESYAKTYNKLQDKYGSRVNPNRYANGSQEFYNELSKKQVLNNMIDILAGNEFKSIDATERSLDLYTKASANKTLGSSLASAYNILGSEVNLKKEMSVLDLEIETKNEQLKSEGISKDSKDKLKSEIELKEKQKKSLQEWLDNKDELIDERKVTKSYDAFKNYLELKNKEFGKTTTINVNEVEDLFLDFNDYIKLNKKSQDHVDAINTLSNPKYFDQVYNRMLEGSQKAYLQLLHDAAKEEIAAGKTKPNEHFIIEVNGVYGVFTPFGKIVFVANTIEEAREVKEKMDVAIYSKEDLEEMFSDSLAEVDEEFAKEKEKEKEVKKESKKEDGKKEIKFIINNKVAIVISEKIDAKDNLKIFEYVFEDDAEKEVYQFKIIDKKVIDVDTGEEITLSRIEPKEKLGDKSIDEQIAELEAKIQALPNKGMVAEGDMVTSSKERDDLKNQIKELKAKKETKEEVTTTSDIKAKKDELQYSIKQLEKQFQDRVDALVANGATETEAKKIALQETSKKDINALEKLKAELAALEEQPEKTEEIEDDDTIEDIDQIIDDIKKVLDESSRETDKIFQEGMRQTEPALSLGNTTHFVETVEIKPGVERFERGEINKTYEFEVATPTFIPGQSVTFKVDEFDGINYNNANIGIYAIINNKETRIGAVHTPQWIAEQKGPNKAYTHIVIPESEKYDKLPKTLEKELETNENLRNLILDNYKNNPNFVLNGTINDKSVGIIVTMDKQGTLAERLNPEIGKGGLENRHGMFGIIRDGSIQIDKSYTIDDNKLVSVKSFNSDNISQYKGYTVMLIPSPTGQFFPTFIKLPNVAREQSEFILKAWKVFTGKEKDDELIKQVYEAVGAEYVKGSLISIDNLKKYINHYITNLNSKSLSQLGNGADAPENTSRLDIFADGNIKLQGKKDGKWISITIRKEDDIPTDVLDYMDNLITTVRFTDSKYNALLGINSTDKVSIFGVKNNKLYNTKMTYNQYIMEGAKTYLEKGIESKNKYNDWVYFANPVIKFQYAEPIKEEPLFNKDETKEKEPISKEVFENEPEEDVFAQLERAIIANNISDTEVKEESKKCTGNPFADA